MWPVSTLIAVAGSLMILERIIPDQKLPKASGWWLRVIAINLAQLGIVITGGLTWEVWMQGEGLFDLAHLPPTLAAFMAYLMITLIFYWWHRWRHDWRLLWRICHQIHHSPGRIETITSFYKHPLEIFINSILITGVAYVLLGLSLEAGGWLTVYTGLAEFFYHMNIKTPRWIGYIIQRPESHRIHHKMGKHYNNFADLPLWDILFGTFENPKTTTTPCGFEGALELKFVSMLLFRDVAEDTD